MNYDLKIIKDNYGERFMHLCRELFPTLLEAEGLLSTLILKKFNPSKFLYEDLIENELVYDFKNYIYSLVDAEKKEIIGTHKTPRKLLSEAGYNFYECKTEEEIQSFKKYYESDEELCTFNGGRLDRCYVFWAVKKGVEDIKRKNYKHPSRDDEYGTSVMSIQFTKGNVNTLSIKNRYNHTVNNPDATLSNNLENIIPGLTESFEKEYNLHINQTETNNFEIPGYVRASDGKYYKYNYEIKNIYYCPDNIIIDNFEVKKYPKERYIILDYFILDLKEKTLEIYDKSIRDDFTSDFQNIIKISVTKSKDNENKQIEIIPEIGEKVIIEIDKNNKLIGYKNNNIRIIYDFFLYYNSSLKQLELQNVECIGDQFLFYNKDLEVLNLPKVKKIDNYFLRWNNVLQQISAPNLLEVGRCFMYENSELQSIDFPSLKVVGGYFIYTNRDISSAKFPELIEVDIDFMFSNLNLTCADFPKLREVASGFLDSNEKIKEINFPELMFIGVDFLCHNQALTKIELPKAKKIGGNFMFRSKNIESVFIPFVEEIGSSFLRENEKLKRICLKKVKKVGHSFLKRNKNIVEVDFPLLEEIDYHFMYNSEKINYSDFPSLNNVSKNLLEYEREGHSYNQLCALEDSIYNSTISKVNKTNKFTNLINKILKKDNNKVEENHIK